MNPFDELRIEVTEDSVTIDGFYEIALSRIPDPRGLCEWIHHLSQKAWVDARLINDLIEAVFQAKGWTIYKHL